ncbi:CDP-alcohol phosphatidyltransferase family protein [Wenxinia saemankumensis]|uniref:Phosphatidylglycerophosphate synthase n=1 Tax=Wenxinia saemankumensis TaxID=1447782 RepID=A0A1M6HF06_9RHOB|nr:CDP-alcohol phosphatidyltransferase family protein [Wenxinia saemankumensis]SHJ20778.1 Phosphatidylglycerophosphate synthase [Wenxinia saemankumensis]
MSALHLGVVAGGIAALEALFPALAAGQLPVLALAVLMAATIAGLMHAARGGSYPHGRFGACNGVTYLRGSLACLLALPLAAPSALADPDLGWTIFAIGAVALSLDGVDGWLARRSGLASAFGARFDMEIDSVLALILALLAWAGGAAGPLVLVLGLARYVFVAAGWTLPWLAAPLPPSFLRKTICVVQLGTLIALQAPILPDRPGHAAAIGAALLLAFSFGRDIRWLAARGR